MQIKVEYENKILGNGIFWEGDSSRIDEIRNIPARMLAKRVAADGVTKKSGMWVVSKKEEV